MAMGSECLNLLKAHGAGGWTPLMLATLQYDFASVEALLRSGAADVTASNKVCSLQHCHVHSSFTVLVLLLSAVLQHSSPCLCTLILSFPEQSILIQEFFSS